MTAGASADDPVAALLEALPDAVLVVDAQGVVAMANARAQALLGAEGATAQGRPVSELLQAPEGLAIDPWGPVDPAADRPLRRLALSVRRASGGALPVQAVLASSNLGVVVTLREVEPGEPEAAERLAAVVRSSADAILSMDLAGSIISWNPGAERMYGYSAEEAIGESVMILIDEEHRREMEDVLARVGRGEVVEELLTRRVTKSGDGIMISLSASPLRDGRGAIAGAATVARDMTERALIEEELRRSNQDLEQFAYVASHDLSEPLRVIAGFVDLLARRYRGRLDEDADRFIDFIVTGVERMQRLIDDLLLYSRAGRGQLQRTSVDVGEVVRDVLWALGPQLRDREVEVDVAELPTVLAERAMLRQIFQNLISNAIKFGDPSRPWVRIRAVHQPGAWRFEVEDNGAGIEPRYAERIFEMFQRLHGREVPGSGMGLAIVKRLTERLGGRVAVAPADPKGSIFTVTIPDRDRPPR